MNELINNSNKNKKKQNTKINKNIVFQNNYSKTQDNFYPQKNINNLINNNYLKENKINPQYYFFDILNKNNIY